MVIRFKTSEHVWYNNKLPYDYFVVFLFSMTLIIITIAQKFFVILYD